MDEFNTFGGSSFGFGDYGGEGSLTNYPGLGGSQNFGFGNMLSGRSDYAPAYGAPGVQTGGGSRPGSWISGFPNMATGWMNTLSDALYKAILGRSTSQMAGELGATRAQGAPWQFPQSNIMAAYGQPGNFDKALHAYGSYLAQQRYGSIPAFGLGLAKEGSDLFLGQSSTDDLSADLMGILLGRQAQQ